MRVNPSRLNAVGSLVDRNIHLMAAINDFQPSVADIGGIDTQ